MLATTSRGRLGDDPHAEHWKRLGLMSGAPECVIKAAHRFLIELHHPDRGGDVAAAQRVNVAYDELKGRGTKANEHVASYYDGEPWHVLGVASNADPRLVERAGKALRSELETFARLATKVTWAVDNFGRPAKAVSPRGRIVPPPPQPRVRTPQRAPAPTPTPRPVTPGRPEGLPEAIDFFRLEWGATVTREVRLTWLRNAPYNITVDAASPVTAKVTASKALPGRFVVSLAIDWESPELRTTPSVRGYTLDADVRVRWPGGEALIVAKGVLLYPAIVSASPLSLDLGTVKMGQPTRASLMLISSGATTVEIEPSQWLARVDSAGRRLSEPLKLGTNTPVRVAFDVQWDPIAERTKDTAAGKPVRPTGKIVVRWNGQEIVVPVEMVVTR